MHTIVKLVEALKRLEEMSDLCRSVLALPKVYSYFTYTLLAGHHAARGGAEAAGEEE